ncbi:hypothetical protein B6259_06460 [Ruminococcaceae bacterium CPB6]|nr:hypothetical protein B6259_06460 [Ruminococcaceae bacterium CPB6]
MRYNCRSILSAPPQGCRRFSQDHHTAVTFFYFNNGIIISDSPVIVKETPQCLLGMRSWPQNSRTEEAERNCE